jgi:hypothetical protein
LLFPGFVKNLTVRFGFSHNFSQHNVITNLPTT